MFTRSLRDRIGKAELARRIMLWTVALALFGGAGLLAPAAVAQGGDEQPGDETPPPFEGEKAAEPNWRELPVRMEPPFAHMGMIKAHGATSREFLIFNEGEEPISFTQVRTTCGCVNGEVTTEPVEPGDAATFTIHWKDLQGLNGPQTRRLFLFHDQGGAPILVQVSVGVYGGEDVEDRLEQKRAEAALPQVERQPDKLDFGLIRPGAVHTESVLLRNVGQQPIRFTNVTSTCGCAKGAIEQKIVKPGESARLDVTLEARDNVGPLKQKLTVFIEDSPRRIPIEISAEVTKPINAEPFFLNLLGPRAGEIKLKAVDGAPFKVLSINGKPADGGLKQLRVQHTAPWDLTDVEPEDLDLWFVIETDHPEMPLIELRVVHPALFSRMNQGSHWTPVPDVLVLGRMNAGDSMTKTLKLAKLPRGAEIELSSANGLFDVELIETTPGDREMEITVSLTPTSKAAEQGGLIRGLLVIKTANPEQESTIPLLGIFREQ